MLFQVLKQFKNANQDVKPALFVVEEGELTHFLHENTKDGAVLIFEKFPEENLYLLSNDKD